MDNGQKKTDRVARMSFFWNAVYSGFSALQSFIILFAISRKCELSEAGIVTIAFAIATLAMITAIYGMRNYQVSDVSEEYGFSEYLGARIITVTGSFLLVIIYVGAMTLSGQYTLNKSTIILGIVLLKLTDAFESVYVGRLQQKGRLDIGSMIASVRIILATVVIFILVFLNAGILISIGSGIAVSIVFDLIMLPVGMKSASVPKKPTDWGLVRGLLLTTLPLCIGTSLHNYIGNAPKYLVDYFMDDGFQAISGYIMMPMFIITVLNTFLMQPTVKTLGDVWDSRDMVRMKGMIVRHILFIMTASIGVLFLGWFIGLPFLSWVYNVNLKGYQPEFLVIMIGGTIYTLSAYGVVLLTVIRRQKWVVAGCAAAVATYILFGAPAVKNYGLMGASIMYVISSVVLLLIFCLGMIWKTNLRGVG